MYICSYAEEPKEFIWNQRKTLCRKIFVNTFAEDLCCSFGGTNNFLYTFLHVHGTPKYTYTHTFLWCIWMCMLRLVVWYYGAYNANEAQSFCEWKMFILKFPLYLIRHSQPERYIDSILFRINSLTPTESFVSSECVAQCFSHWNNKAHSLFVSYSGWVRIVVIGHLIVLLNIL